MPLNRSKPSPAAVLILENNILIASDLEECLREIDPNVAIVTLHTVTDALLALSSDITFRLAIVPAKVMNKNDVDLYRVLVAKVSCIAIHGYVPNAARADSTFLYLESPFTSATVNALIGHIISS